MIAIGKLITDKRKALGASYKTREGFIYNRSQEIFNGEAWISVRHLTNLELGKNWPSIEMLLKLSVALEEDPIDFFEEIIKTYQRAIETGM